MNELEWQFITCVLQAAVPASETQSGNSMFGDVTEVNTSSTLAADNTAAHLASTGRIFNNMDSSAVFASVTESYIQANSGAPVAPRAWRARCNTCQARISRCVKN